MSALATKLSTGTAATAIAAATLFAPTGVANAAPAEGSHFGFAGRSVVEPCGPTTTPCAPVADPGVFQSRKALVAAAEATPIFEFNPIQFVPGFLRPLYSWFTQNINFGVCVGGVSVKIGPYGRVTATRASSC